MADAGAGLAQALSMVGYESVELKGEGEASYDPDQDIVELTAKKNYIELIDGAKISYGAKLDNVPRKHWSFIKNGLPYYETGHCIFVHGGLDPDLPLEKQDPEEMAWRRFPDARPHMSGKRVICGHTVQRSGYPNDLGHSTCIDTGACRPGGWLTCLNPMTRHYWQVNEKGKTRDGVLDT